MADNLTQRLKAELARRGKIVTDAEVSAFLESRIQQQVAPPTAPMRSGRELVGDLPEELPSKFNLLNAAGAGLWSALDVAAFGIPGAFVEEEKFIDFEDPMAKWTSAIGGFAGFVAGAPLKVGAKFAQLAARPFIKKIGRESVDTVVRGMKQVGREGGLSRKAAKEVTDGYRSLVTRSKVDPTLRGKEFSNAASKYMNRYLDEAVDLTQVQRDAVKNMFTDNVMRRPLQDFMGVIAERGIAAGSPRLQRVIGHAINDALMFGMIDTIFETTSVIEDHEFDYTAPLWGAATGIVFSQLAWLNPKGKQARWMKDFRAGVRGTFAKNPYAKWGRERLEGAARFMGESSEHYGQSAFRNVSHKGVSGRVNLRSDGIYDEFKSVFGGQADDALKAFLDTERRTWGRELMKWSTAESFQNMQSNWMRMAAGGVLFNFHTFYDMFAHGYEPEVSDILPHFLIGAYVQRHANPSRFDLNATRMNQIRQNLMSLGVHPSQLNEIPSFAYSKNRFDNPFNDPKFKGVKDLATDLGIVSNNIDLTEVPLAEGDISIKVKNTENVRIFNDFIHDWLVKTKKYPKPKDSISVREVDLIVDEFKKADGSLKTYKDFEVVFDEISVKQTKDFDRQFTDILEQVRVADVAEELQIVYDPSRPKDSQVPKHVMVSTEMKARARNGELDFLIDKTTGEVLSGEKAEIELTDKVDGLNKILAVVVSLGKTERMPIGGGNDHRSIKSEELTRNIYNIVTKAEDGINKSFPDNASYADNFTFNKYFNDYTQVLTRNFAIKSADKIYNIFKPENVERDELTGFLNRGGIVYLPEGASVGKIRSDVDNIVITGADKEPERVSQAKMFLHRVLTIQAIAGGYEQVKDAPYKDIKIQDVDALNDFLTKRSFNVMKTKPFMHNVIVDYIIKDKIKRAENLTLHDIDVVMQLGEVGMGGFESAVEGKAAGWTVRLLDESAVASGRAGDVTEYNAQIKKLVENGEGLIRILDEPAKALDPRFIDTLHILLKSDMIEGGNLAARESLIEFMNLLPTDKTPFVTFQKRLNAFISEPGGTNRAILWLMQAGVIQKSGKKSGRSMSVNMEAFNEELALKMGVKFDAMGITQKYAERIYEELEQSGRDRVIQESDEYGFEKSVDLDTFYTMYRINGKDPNELTSEQKIGDFQSLVYTSKADRLLTPDVINKVFDAIHVKIGDEHVPYKSLSKPEQNQRKPEILSNIVGLLSTQRAQVKIDVIKYANGNVTKSEEITQFTRFKQYLSEGLDIPYYIVEPRVPIYEMVDGRYQRLRYIDVFRSSENMDPAYREIVDAHRKDFERLLAPKTELFGESIEGDAGEIGVAVMSLSPNLEPIAVEVRHLSKLKEPFKKFANKYGNMASVSEQSRKVMRDIAEAIENDRPITNAQYEQMMRRLIFEQMLTGSDGNRTFIEFLNGEQTEKIMNRIKLFNTKKFVVANKDFILDVAESYGAIGDKETERVLRRILRNDGFGVAIWNDEGYSTIRAEVELIVKELGVDWKYDEVVGEAHNDVSAFDSISFISKDMMRYIHSIIGHNPNSFNPIKPVISSGGKNSPLLLGKTLFVYEQNLDGFFKQNPNVDILTTKSGVKVFNPVGKPGELDASIINKPWQSLVGSQRPGQRLGPGKIRKISIESLGLLPSKDAEIVTAADSQADHNYRNNRESSKAFIAEFSDILDTNLDSMNEIMEDPISLRAWLLKSMGNEFMTVDAAAGEGINHLSNLFFFSNLSREANPMTYSETMVKNKMYGMYINSLVNNKRSVTNQFSKESSHTYGGQSIMIQSASSKLRLRPTLVGKDGKMKSRGQVLLPSWAADMDLDVLISNGYETRFVRGPEEVLTAKDVASEIVADMPSLTAKRKKTVLVETIEYLNTIKLGELQSIAEDMGLEIGIIVNRKPRTRPNDMSLLGLKGFLPKSYGNSISMSSLDVVNVFEGDYDVDKADFYFASRKNTFDHVQRASQFYVQGVDPTKLKPSSNFHMGMSPGEERKAVRTMKANNDLFKSSIGIVQKVPRMLGYISKLGSSPADVSKDPYLKNYIRKLSDGSEYSPKVLFSGEDFRITIDYENIDWFTRSALETQYIIDGTGKINKDIANDISSWRSDFLFPRIEDSVAPGEAQKLGIGFINDMRTQGHSQGKRVRIFRKFKRTPEGIIQEVELSKLEQVMINEMLREYGSFLNATGKSLFEKTGEQRTPKYEDVMDASEKFFTFNKNVSDNLYYRLRRRRIDPKDPKSKKWHQDRSFQELFEVEERSFKIEGKKNPYWVPTRKVVDDMVNRNGEEFSEGKRGAVIDRVMQRLYSSDPFEHANVKSATGEVRDIMDKWYAQLHGQTGEDWSTSIDKMNSDIASLKFSTDKKIQFIGNWKRKIMQIKNGNASYQIQQKSIGKLNKLISQLENELKPLIPSEYWKTRKTADLKRINFVSVDRENMRKGLIYYSVMDNLNRIMPAMAGDKFFGLSTAGIKDLSNLKKLRQLFYSNRTNLGNVLKYGDKTLIDSDMRQFLSKFPDLSTFYEIETALLRRYVGEHDIGFLYAFMKPALNKYDVGVFEGRAVSVPYQATEKYDPSSRYRRGLKFLTDVATNRLPGLVLPTSEQINARKTLQSIQTIEAQFERYYNRKFDLRNIVGKNIGDFIDVSQIGESAKMLIMDNIRMPNFHKDIENAYTNFRGIRWSRDNGRISSGFDLTNDHLLDFYYNVMKLAGKEKDFDSYLHSMNDIQMQMTSNNFIDPMEYLAKRSMIESEIKDIVRDVFTGAIIEDTNNPLVRNILNNPIYAIVGGKNYFRGLSFERRSPLNIDRLREMKELSDSLEESYEKSNFKTDRVRKLIKETLNKCVKKGM